MNTSLLLQRCRAGDDAAVEELVRSYERPVSRLALAILDDPAEAEDAVQDAFVAAIGALGSYRGESSFKTWLFAIVVNACRRRLRGRRTRERITRRLGLTERSAHATAGGIEELAARDEAGQLLWQEITTLDDRHRLPLILRYYHDLPAAEIARVLGISEGTVHSRLHTARERLKQVLKDRIEP